LPSTETTKNSDIGANKTQPELQLDSSSSLRYDYSLDSFDETSHYGRLLGRVGRNKKVLELGSSTGYLTSAMTDHFGCSVTGVEVDTDAAMAARAKGHEVFILDLDKANLAEALAGLKFDVVLCADVLEHLRSPEETLRQVKSILNEGGYLVCSIPHVGHGDIRLSLLAGRLPYRSMGLLDHTHMKFFTRALVEELFEVAGFCIEQVDRNRWQLTKTEVQGRLPSALQDLSDFIACDPESETYQFIVKARPYKESEKLGPTNAADLVRVDVVVIDQDSEKADDLYQKYLTGLNYPAQLLKFWFVSADGGLALADKPKGHATPYNESDFRTFRFTGMGSRDQQMTVAPPIFCRQSKRRATAQSNINIAATLAQVARGSDAKYLFVLLANTLPGSNCLSRLVKSAEGAAATGSERTAATGSERTAATGAERAAATGSEDSQALLLPLVGARPEIRLPDQALPQGVEGYLSWHDFSALLIPRDYLLEAKSADPNLWTVQAQAVDMCFRAWACGRRLFECSEANYFSNGPVSAWGDYDDTVADGLRLRRRWGSLRNILAFAKYSASLYGRGQPLVWVKTASHILAALTIETPLKAALPAVAQPLVGFGGPGAHEIGQTADRRL
jgi:2-polyprenyl-3-methyl-5-hydroxy-6-metoxy-1,4-benzoquinol methylase